MRFSPTKKSLLLALSAPTILCIGFATNSQAANVNLSWSPSTDADLAGYSVYYGTASRTYGTPVNVGLVSAYTLTGFNAGTYYFAVTAYDSSGNESAFSNEASRTITSTPDTTAPVISGVGASSLASSGATINWTTNEASDSQVEYGTTTAYGSSSTLSTSLVTSHSMVLSGLQASKLYHYRVKSRDAVSNLAVSADFTFTTLAAGSGLVAAYSFNEGSGMTITDSSGNSNSGTTSGPTWTAPGKFGSALSFDGVNDYVTIPNSSWLDISGTNLTISFWTNIQNNNDGIDDVILAKLWAPTNSSPYYQYGIEFDANGAKTLDFFFGDTSGTLRGPFSMTPSLGLWTYVTFTYDGTAVKGYLDGVQKFSTSTTQSIQARGNVLQLGVDAALGQPFSGKVDEVRIYNRALSQAEIQADMNAPVGAAAPPQCDCNTDGVTNALDLQAEVNAILGANTTAGFDINRDGTVNALDLQVLGNVVLGVTTCP
jgi:hypothetical protein